jgi:nuclear GTP-binding protein
VWQYITLMKRIYLIDCPGCVPPSMNDTPEDILLRGVVRTENVEHPAQYIPAVLKRCATRHLERTYEVKGWEEKPTSTAEEEENRPSKTDKVRVEESVRFLEMIARKSGRLIKGGEADIDGIAKQVINDFLRGKIPWYVAPPITEGAEAEAEEKAKGRDAKLGLTGKKRKAEEEAEAEDESVTDKGDDSSAEEEFAGFDEGEGGVSLVVDEESGKNEAKA